VTLFNSVPASTSRDAPRTPLSPRRAARRIRTGLLLPQHHRPVSRHGDQPARGPGDLPARRTGSDRRPCPRRRAQAGGPDRRSRELGHGCPCQLPDRQPGTEEFLSSRLLRRRLDQRLRPAVAEHIQRRLRDVLDQVHGTGDLSFHLAAAATGHAGQEDGSGLGSGSRVAGPRATPPRSASTMVSSASYNRSPADGC